MDGARQELFLCWSQACVSQTCSSAAINPKPLPLKPASNKVTVLQTKEAGSTKGEEAGQEIRGRNGKQAVRTDSKCTSEGRQEEAGVEPRPWREGLQTGCLSARAGRVWRGGWANPQGSRQTNPSSSLWFDLIYVATLKTLGRNKITEDHCAGKSKAAGFLLQSECQRSI